MEYILGILTGIAISILTVLTLTFFRSAIEQRIKVIEKQIANVGPRPKGFIVNPEDEADEIRREIVEKNRLAGRDTNISELE